MKLVIVSDIFGKTASLMTLVDDLSPHFKEVEFITPYGNELQEFADEQEAYLRFTHEIGIDSYTRRLSSKLGGTEAANQLLLGFSAGATTIWLASAHLGALKNTKAICFYSSQIRNLLTVKPHIEIDLYFAKTEPKYDVDDVVARLETTENVSCYKTMYHHGFMNQNSQNYNSKGYNHYLNVIHKNL